MISLDKRLNKALWHINATSEIFSYLSINSFPRMIKVEGNNIPKEMVNLLNASYKRAKNLFNEGKKQFVSIYKTRLDSFSSFNIINKKYFERCLIYLMDSLNLFNSVCPFIKSKTIELEIKDNIKILIMQIKNVADLLR